MKLVDGTREAELVRPFAKDQLYAILYVYSAILGRIIVLLKDSKKKGSVPFWPRDPVIKQHLQVLLSPQELQQFEKRQLGQYMWIRGVLEAKFLSTAQVVVMGQESADSALQESNKVRDRLRELEESQASKRQKN